MNARKKQKKDWNLIENLWTTNKKQLKFDIGRVSDAVNPNKIDSNRGFFIITVGIGWIPDAGNPWKIDQNQYFFKQLLIFDELPMLEIRWKSTKLDIF